MTDLVSVRNAISAEQLRREHAPALILGRAVSKLLEELEDAGGDVSRVDLALVHHEQRLEVIGGGTRSIELLLLTAEAPPRG